MLIDLLIDVLTDLLIKAAGDLLKASRIKTGSK